MAVMDSDITIFVKIPWFILINFCEEFCKCDHAEICEQKNNTKLVSCITLLAKAIQRKCSRKMLPWLRICYS